ncbi:MAG: PrgI family protein [Clostridia bacterium]|nr:PrgI family protein [Clostridia bacterium]
MGTYNVPRNVKGEGRILFIFSTKSLITTFIGGIFGLLFYFIFSAVGLKLVGIVITLIFALIGYAIGMFKVPDTNGLEITRKTGGENIDDIIKRYIKFKKNNKKIYVYIDTKEENTNG